MNNKKNNTNHDSDNNNQPDHILARLNHVENSIHKQNRPWYRVHSNLISILAIFVTAGIFLSSQMETRFQKAQRFSQILDEISALANEEIEIYQKKDMPPNFRISASMMIANRRAALINQADRLRENRNISNLDLVLLTPAYTSIGRYDQAEDILLNFARDEKEQLALRITAWRSLIALYSNLGPERINDAKEAAENGLKLIKDCDDNLIKDCGDNILMQNESVIIRTSLALYFQTIRSYKEAFSNLLAAEQEAWLMSCTSNRYELLNLLQSEIAKALSNFPEGQKVLNESRATYGQPCPDDPATTFTALATHNGVASTLDYVGDYMSEFGVVNVWENDEGVLKVTINDKKVLTLVSIGSDLFSTIDVANIYLAFKRNDAKEVTQVLFLQPNGIFPARRN